MEIVEDAVKNNHDVDSYLNNVTNFVQKRLKYKFRERCDTFLEPRTTSTNNCALHNIGMLKNIDFDNGLKGEKQMIDETIMNSGKK